MKTRFFSLISILTLTLPQISAAWGTYPGCTYEDIVFGNQVWASCNAVGTSEGSAYVSGWFIWGQALPVMISPNGGSSLYQGYIRSTARSEWSRGPCASGYSIPTRYEWEEASLNARRNGSNISLVLGLPRNGSGVITRDKRGNIIAIHPSSSAASYWTSTAETIGKKRVPMLLHIGQYYGYNRYDTTEQSSSQSSLTWEQGDDERELVERSMDEVAHVRCIRSF